MQYWAQSSGRWPGQNGLRVRLHAWLQHRESAELKGKFKVLPVSLALPDRVDELIESLKDFAPDVVAIDTLNAYFGGATKIPPRI